MEVSAVWHASELASDVRGEETASAGLQSVCDRVTGEESAAGVMEAWGPVTGGGFPAGDIPHSVSDFHAGPGVIRGDRATSLFPAMAAGDRDGPGGIPGFPVSSIPVGGLLTGRGDIPGVRAFMAWAGDSPAGRGVIPGAHRCSPGVIPVGVMEVATLASAMVAGDTADGATEVAGVMVVDTVDMAAAITEVGMEEDMELPTPTIRAAVMPIPGMAITAMLPFPTAWPHSMVQPCRRMPVRLPS